MIARSLFLALILGAASAVAAPCAIGQSQSADQAQNQAGQQFLMPAESAAKAKELLHQAIQALGGDAYLNVKDVTCTLRVSNFGHSGELNGFGKETDYAIPPNKERDENLPKRNIISVNDGDKGWSLDRGGVSQASITDVATFQENVKKDIDNILRHRIHEPGMIFRYGGIDIVDYYEADWVELVDSDNRTFRIAIAKETHLPIRMVIDTRDANTRMRSQEVDYYSNYHPIQGIQTPFQITRDRNGIKMYQVFFDKCEYNTGLSPDLFTRESLEERWQKIGPKKKKNDKDDSDSKN
ncbi:MAG: hypothetical protein WA823_14510 [Candidatus Acidiferrales bacterium]